MATYRTIAASEVDADSPVTATLMEALAENPTAIAEGASGAPPIEDAALDTTATTAGETWVQERTALSSQGDVGTYALAKYTNAATLLAGATTSGSNLEYSNVSGTGGVGVISGTWRNMGGPLVQNDVSLFLRIS